MRSLRVAAALGALWLPACYRAALVVAPVEVPLGHGEIRVSALDATPKESPRLLPPEAYLRTWLTMLGGPSGPLLPLAAQRRARGSDGGQVFDTWADYLGALGFPDYRLDLPRAQGTNAVMVAAFERLGEALCDRALEYDLRGALPPPPPAGLSPIGAQPPPPPPTVLAPGEYGPPLDPAVAKAAPKPAAKAPPGPPALAPVGRRVLFNFDNPAAPLDEAGFAARFEVLHRAFLGYPLRLAPEGRVAGFYALYRDTAARHAQKGAPRSRFTPTEAGWAAVCYGLSRHPEFHLY